MEELTERGPEPARRAVEELTGRGPEPARRAVDEPGEEPEPGAIARSSIAFLDVLLATRQTSSERAAFSWCRPMTLIYVEEPLRSMVFPALHQRFVLIAYYFCKIMAEIRKSAEEQRDHFTVFCRRFTRFQSMMDRGVPIDSSRWSHFLELMAQVLDSPYEDLSCIQNRGRFPELNINGVVFTMGQPNVLWRSVILELPNGEHVAVGTRTARTMPSQ